MGGISARGEHPPPFAFGAQSCFTHQPGDPFASNASSPITQLRMQAWAAVAALMSTNFLSNLFCELGIFSLMLTDRTLSPSIKATFRDSEHLAYDHDREFLLVLFDKLIFHLDSREKMLIAFFNMSRSC